MIQHVLLLARRGAADRARAPVDPPVALVCHWTPAGDSRAISATAERTAPLRAREPSARATRTASFLAFSVVLLAWHVPALFDATLRSGGLHALEHSLFFATALMFWKQVIPSPPLHCRLVAAQRVVYAIGAMIVSWVLAVVLALAPHPLYPYYAHLAEPPGWHLRARRPATRRRRDVGAGLDHVLDRRLRLRPPLARAARGVGLDSRSATGERALESKGEVGPRNG